MEIRLLEKRKCCEKGSVSKNHQNSWAENEPKSVRKHEAMKLNLNNNDSRFLHSKTRMENA